MQRPNKGPNCIFQTCAKKCVGGWERKKKALGIPKGSDQETKSGNLKLVA
jgi:hypothetical protein